MLKNVSKIEAQINGRMYHMLCDTDSPIDHVKEFLFYCHKVIGQIEDVAKARQESEQQDQQQVENV